MRSTKRQRLQLWNSLKENYAVLGQRLEYAPSLRRFNLDPLNAYHPDRG